MIAIGEEIWPITLHVVLGGTGGAGSAVVAELVRRGLRVRSVSRQPGAAQPGIEPMAADLSDPAAMRPRSVGASVVYQCMNLPYHRWVAEFPPIQANLIAAVEAAGAKLVLADNLYMYGPADGVPARGQPQRATDPKGLLRKGMAEELLAAHAAGRIRVAIGRSSDYFGPGQVNSAVGELLFGAVVAGKQPRWLVDLGPAAQPELPARHRCRTGDAGCARGGRWPRLAPARRGDDDGDRVGRAGGIGGGSAAPARPHLATDAHAGGPLLAALRELRGTLYQWERPWVMDDSAFRSAFSAVPTPLDAAIEATLAA